MDEFEIKLFWERVNLAYAELKKNPIAWKEEQEERLAWDATLADGLEEEEELYSPQEMDSCREGIKKTSYMTS